MRLARRNRPLSGREGFAERRAGLPLDAVLAEAGRCLTCGGKAVPAYTDDCMTCYTCEVRCPAGAVDVHPFKERLPRTLDTVRRGKPCTQRRRKEEEKSMNMTPWTLSADVLIVGGGFAGMWAAKKARDHVRDVLIVDKGPRDWGGLGSMCGGDMIARMPDDDLDAMLKELVYYYDGLVEQDLMEEILRQSSDRFRDYEALGHTFRKDAEGNYIPVSPARTRQHEVLPFRSTGFRRRESAQGN